MRSWLYQALLMMRGKGLQITTKRLLEQVELLSATEIGELQQKRLRALLLHAYENVPYYRKVIEKLGGREILLKHDPTDVLRFFPILTKQIIREKWEELKSQDLSSRSWYYNTSGGSTGEPVKLIQDKDFHLQGQALKDFYDSWTGYRVGMPKVILWGSERDLLVGKETWKIRFGRWLSNGHWLNAFRMGEAEMRRYVKIINRVKPIQILAYAEAIYELAKFIEKEKLVVWQPCAVMTSAGTLYGYMRETIERVFRAPVFNRYGSREVGDIACECEAHRGLHVCPLTHYVEIISENGGDARLGEVGEVLVTSLTNYAMPLIRYRIGDMAAWAEENCSCGRNWPLLKEVIGRVTDIFIGQNGKKIVPEYFIHMIGVVLKPTWLHKFQIIQEDYDLIRILVVPSVEMAKGRELIEKEKSKLEQMVCLVMGDECRLEIELVENIPPSPSGKYRYTISKVGEHG